jgi:hypothetical protein
MLLLSRDRLYLVAAFLILSFAVFMSVMNSEAHRALVEHLRTSAALKDALANVKPCAGSFPSAHHARRSGTIRATGVKSRFSCASTRTPNSATVFADCIRRLYPELSEAPESQSS